MSSTVYFGKWKPRSDWSFELLRRLRNGQSTSGAYDLDCFLDAGSGHDQQAGCDQARTPDALAAMNGDVLALLQRDCDVAQ
jgi:hypothetical protein